MSGSLRRTGDALLSNCAGIRQRKPERKQSIV